MAHERNIIIKDAHFKPYYSEALGCKVSSMKERAEIMKRNGLSEYDSSVTRKREAYKPSRELHEMANAIAARADKHGNVQLGSVMIEKMKKNGVTFDAKKIREAQGKKGFN